MKVFRTTTSACSACERWSSLMATSTSSSAVDSAASGCGLELAIWAGSLRGNSKGAGCKAVMAQVPWVAPLCCAGSLVTAGGPRSSRGKNVEVAKESSQTDDSSLRYCVCSPWTLITVAFVTMARSCSISMAVWFLCAASVIVSIACRSAACLRFSSCNCSSWA